MQSQPGRANQRRRTRKDLLAAAGRLLREGRKPSLEEVAEEAMVSRATAYRYFPSVEALLVEAPIELAFPEAADIFTGDTATDPAARLEKAELALDRMVYDNAVPLRIMLAHLLMQQVQRERDDESPVRQNRRTPLIEAALAPARERFGEVAYRRLCAAMALVFGTESMIVFDDVLQEDAETVRDVKQWIIRSLVRAALEDSGASGT